MAAIFVWVKGENTDSPSRSKFPKSFPSQNNIYFIVSKVQYKYHKTKLSVSTNWNVNIVYVWDQPESSSRRKHVH